jgi:hypothetical protein
MSWKMDTSSPAEVTLLFTPSRQSTSTTSSEHTVHVPPLSPTYTVHSFAATKVGAIVGGQTSCKAPEIAAFEKYLPEDVEILPIHSLHGPNVDPRGQPLVSLPPLIFSYR